MGAPQIPRARGGAALQRRGALVAGERRVPDAAAARPRARGAAARGGTEGRVAGRGPC